ncbi:MAG: alpha/beta hydrolase [Jatrophihabitantaceae bacterium]
MAHRLGTVKAPDGRALGVAQWGDPDGSAVFGLHGTPGSRFGRPSDEAGLERAGLRMVTYDRPGYGVSDRQPGRRVVECAEDVAAIADALDIGRFAVTGGSGGGPHALAVAARLGRRVTAAECRVGAAPFDAEGLDWWAGMDPQNVREFRWAIEGEQVLRERLAPLAAQDLARIAKDPSKILSDDWQLADADRERLARPDVQRMLVEGMRGAYAAGVWGWVDDDLRSSPDGASAWMRSRCRSPSATARRMSSFPPVTAPGWPRTSPERRLWSPPKTATFPIPTPGSRSCARWSRPAEPPELFAAPPGVYLSGRRRPPR